MSQVCPASLPVMQPGLPMQPHIAPSARIVCGDAQPFVVRDGAGDMQMATFSVRAISSATSSMTSAGTPQISAAHAGVFG